MTKLFYFFMIFPILFCSQISTIDTFLSGSSEIVIYKDSQIVKLSTDEQTEIKNLLIIAFGNAVQMPAYSVCIDEFVKEEINEGYWLKIIYNDTQIKDEMHYDELLIHIENNLKGVNILRGNDGKFEGRCYYFILENNLNDVYQYIDTLSQSNIKKVEIELESQETGFNFLEKDEEKEKKDDNNESNSRK